MPRMSFSEIAFIEIKKLPKGDGNLSSFIFVPIFAEIKKLPKGDEVSFLVFCLMYKKREFLIMMLEGSRTSISNIYISARKLEAGEQNELRVHL